MAAGLRLEFHRDDVRARSRLRHREAADVLARDQPGQVFGFLFGIAPAADLVDAEVGMRAVAETDRSRGAADLLHRDDVIEIAQAEPAIFFLDGDAVESQRAHFGPERAIELVLRSEEHTSELPSLMRISYAVFC